MADFLRPAEDESEGDCGTLKQSLPPKTRLHSSWLLTMWISGGAMQQIPA